LSNAAQGGSSTRRLSCAEATEFAFQNSGKFRRGTTNSLVHRVGMCCGDCRLAAFESCLHRAALVIGGDATSILVRQVNLHSRDVTREMLKTVGGAFPDSLFHFCASLDVVVRRDCDLHTLNLASSEASSSPIETIIPGIFAHLGCSLALSSKASGPAPCSTPHGEQHAPWSTALLRVPRTHKNIKRSVAGSDSGDAHPDPGQSLTR